MKNICVFGLGYIGLPTAALFAHHGANVVGVDVNPHAVDTINQGKIHIVEPGLEAIVKTAVDKGSSKPALRQYTQMLILSLYRHLLRAIITSQICPIFKR
ncbi:UDP-glucose dehydrogenase [Psychrobacter sp. JCM 18903]|nr:UDP-glucose dehydrogenase [Psychrobacter sp. JCM 18903]